MNAFQVFAFVLTRRGPLCRRSFKSAKVLVSTCFSPSVHLRKGFKEHYGNLSPNGYRHDDDDGDADVDDDGVYDDDDDAARI